METHKQIIFFQHPVSCTNHFSVFHILNSLHTTSTLPKEACQLQNILLKFFEGEPFKEGRITTNIPQVIPLSSFPIISIGPCSAEL